MAIPGPCINANASLRIAIGNSLADVGPAIDRITVFCKENMGAITEGDAIAQKIELSTTEAITNIVKHAYGAAQTGPIDILVERAGDRFIITLRDVGREIPGGIEQLGLTLDVGDDIAGLPVGGMGWFMIKSDMDFVEYTRSSDVNQLVLVKYL